jgi:hypothetical protein
LVGKVLDEDAGVVIAFGDEFDVDLMVIDRLEEIGPLWSGLIVGGWGRLGDERKGEQGGAEEWK